MRRHYVIPNFEMVYLQRKGCQSCVLFLLWFLFGFAGSPCQKSLRLTLRILRIKTHQVGSSSLNLARRQGVCQWTSLKTLYQKWMKPYSWIWHQAMVSQVSQMRVSFYTSWIMVSSLRSEATVDFLGQVRFCFLAQKSYKRSVTFMNLFVQSRKLRYYPRTKTCKNNFLHYLLSPYVLSVCKK